MVKSLPVNTGDNGLVSGEGNGSPPQYSCLENPMARGTWQATVHVVAESDMTEQLIYTHVHLIRELSMI